MTERGEETVGEKRRDGGGITETTTINHFVSSTANSTLFPPTKNNNWALVPARQVTTPIIGVSNYSNTSQVPRFTVTL